jgi:hypothetical protein
VVVRGWNSVISVRHEDHNDLYWFGPLESKTLRVVWYWNYVERDLPPWRALQAALYWLTTLGYKSVSIYPNWLQQGKLSELVCLVLYSKLSSHPSAHTLGRVGPTDRSAGLLVGRARLSGMAETLVGGDPWVPMSHKPPIDV